MGAIFFSLDRDLAILLQQQLRINIFFETGTFEGATSLLMAPLFPRLITVEISEQLYKAAIKKLSVNPNVEVIHGSSSDVLRTKRSDLKEQNVLYWLDAHWCNNEGTGGASNECPLMEEIDAIASLGENSVILIDDARYFLAPPPAPHEASKWPDIMDVTEALRRLSDKHRLVVVNDTILFVPAYIYPEIVAYVRKKGVDLVALTRAALQNRAGSFNPAAIPMLAQGPGGDLRAGFNKHLLQQNNPERIFAFHASHLGISRLLDIGSHGGQFATRMRKFGFSGFIYSIEPQLQIHRQLRHAAEGDVKWMPLSRQAAGAETATLNLNISENSWSSSLLNVHENHLRADAATRVVTREEVPVTRTKDLLHESLMKEIDAVKIDVQGYEMQVLEGLGSYIENVKLLLVEMSMVECYVGAPDLFTLDKMIVERFGFKRITLEPSYYDDTTGTVQQYDGIYVREPAPVLSTKASLIKFAGIVTSSHGQPSRRAPNGAEIGDRWLEFCVNSWRSIASRVISVSEIAPSHQGIEWIKVQSRPTVAEMIGVMKVTRDEHYILCNADIMLTPTLDKISSQLDPAAVYLANRVEVELNASDMQTIDLKSVHKWGYDLFIFPPEFVQFSKKFNTIMAGFRIGEPWWDYLIPIMALAGGFPVKRLPVNDPVALHYSHATNYDQATWVQLGTKFLQALKLVSECSVSGRVPLIDEILKVEGEQVEKLNKISTLICSSTP